MNSGAQFIECNFTCNSAVQYGGGLYFGEDHATVHLTDSWVEGNRASVAGGEEPVHMDTFVTLLDAVCCAML
jgi:hypothetical protein